MSQLLPYLAWLSPCPSGSHLPLLAVLAACPPPAVSVAGRGAFGCASSKYRAALLLHAPHFPACAVPRRPVCCEVHVILHTEDSASVCMCCLKACACMLVNCCIGACLLLSWSIYLWGCACVHTCALASWCLHACVRDRGTLLPPTLTLARLLVETHSLSQGIPQTGPLGRSLLVRC